MFLCFLAGVKMKVNLKQVPPDGQPLQVRADLDLSGLRRWGEHPIPSPVRLEASLANNNGILALRYRAQYRLEGLCSRCLKPVQRLETLENSHILMENVEDEKNDAFILVPDAMLDLRELVTADISLALNGVLLCGDQCKGLCPVCGADRNETDCTCEIPELTDPRFDSLRELLDGQNG